MDALDEGRKKQDRAIKKGKDAELRARKLEVSLNSVRCDASITRKPSTPSWETTGVYLHAQYPAYVIVGTLLICV